MLQWDRLKLRDFLSLHPKMRLAEYGEKRTIIEGEYNLNAQMDGYEAVRDSYKLKITFPSRYPQSLPRVIEIGNRIPKNPNHHINSDGSFCFGSEVRLKFILLEYPTIIDFAERILDPFLYAISYKIRYNLYPFGELKHGVNGLIDDYKRFFNVPDEASVLQVLKALGKKQRDANKLICPCGCGKRIGKCDFRFNLQRWRCLDKQSWFREHLSEIKIGMKNEKYQVRTSSLSDFFS